MRYSKSLLMLTTLLGVPQAVSPQTPELPAEVREWMSEAWQPRFLGMVAEGDSLFNSGSCQRCHGEKGSGGRWAPDLTDDEWVQSDGSLAGIFQTIFWGVRRRDFHDPNRRFEMNPKGGMSISWDQTRALAAYVWTLSRLPRSR
jgi:mono/diheme cytochrome c family protein